MHFGVSNRLCLELSRTFDPERYSVRQSGHLISQLPCAFTPISPGSTPRVTRERLTYSVSSCFYYWRACSLLWVAAEVLWARRALKARTELMKPSRGCAVVWSTLGSGSVRSCTSMLRFSKKEVSA